MRIVTDDQGKRVVEALLEFVHRVASSPNASPAEIAALPEIAKVLFWLNPPD